LRSFRLSFFDLAIGIRCVLPLTISLNDCNPVICRADPQFCLNQNCTLLKPILLYPSLSPSPITCSHRFNSIVRHRTYSTIFDTK
jgi:hypothetical protein